MTDCLIFDDTKYEVMTCTFGQESVTYRAFLHLPYCTAPVAEIQQMNLFVPEVYYAGGSIHGYDLHTAPIFMPNTVGGYMEGPADEPGRDFKGEINSIFYALQHGYVVASAGVRGRTTGRASTEFFEGSAGRRGPQDVAAAKQTGTDKPQDSATAEPADASADKAQKPMGAPMGFAPPQDLDPAQMVGKAPALIVDMKAAIRYLHYNADRLPGDAAHIITNGTSAGGALSALAGATGNSMDYEPYLREIGAAEAPDTIFAASCYCPIHNLEHADAAYEWLFCGCNEFHQMKFEMTDNGPRRIPLTGTMTAKQQEVSAELKAQFPAYVNGLQLTDADGAPLTLDADGNGSFRDYVAAWVMASAQKELDTHDTENRLSGLMVDGSAIEQQDYLHITDGKVTDLDWEGYVRTITRMKTAPAFDALDLNSPENEEFGDAGARCKHFTAYSAAHSEAGGTIADAQIIHMMNPIDYILTTGQTIATDTSDASTVATPDAAVGVATQRPSAPAATQDAATTAAAPVAIAPHWRIRHGAFDRDTAIAIPVILATLLQNNGYDVDFFLPWGLPHSGDYDLDELFAWIDRIVR